MIYYITLIALKHELNDKKQQKLFLNANPSTSMNKLLYKRTTSINY